jgi:hypothetical protein
LNVLAKTGFIDRKNVFNAGTNQRRLFIRFRADRILQAIDEVIELRKAGVDPAKDVVSDHTLGGGSVEVEPGDGDEKEGLESVPGKAVTSAMHDPIFIINREVADQPSAISDATASLPATVVTTDSPGTQKIKSAGRQPANDIFCFPKHFGNDELIQMIKLIMNQYDMGEITFGQARQIKIWYNSPSASSHMDLKILEDMFARIFRSSFTGAGRISLYRPGHTFFGNTARTYLGWMVSGWRKLTWQPCLRPLLMPTFGNSSRGMPNEYKKLKPVRANS